MVVHHNTHKATQTYIESSMETIANKQEHTLHTQKATFIELALDMRLSQLDCKDGKDPEAVVATILPFFRAFAEFKSGYDDAIADAMTLLGRVLECPGDIGVLSRVESSARNRFFRNVFYHATSKLGPIIMARARQTCEAMTGSRKFVSTFHARRDNLTIIVNKLNEHQNVLSEQGQRDYRDDLKRFRGDRD